MKHFFRNIKNFNIFLCILYIRDVEKKLRYNESLILFYYYWGAFDDQSVTYRSEGQCHA